MITISPKVKAMWAMDKIKWDFIQLWINKKAFLLKKKRYFACLCYAEISFWDKKIEYFYWFFKSDLFGYSPS
jgi:hypothetical protein